MTKIYALLLVLAVLASLQTQADEMFTIGISCPTGKDCKAPELENAISEAYGRAGLNTRFVYTPRLRDLQQADAGATDATAVCSREALPNYPMLELLSTPIVQIDACAYSFDPSNAINSPEDLASLSVGVIRGQYVAVKLSKEWARETHEINTLENLIALMRIGRVDAIVLNRTSGRHILSDIGITDYLESPVLSSTYLYHAVNKDKYTQEQKAEIDAALLEMLQDGTMKRLYGKFQDMAPRLPLQEDR